MVGKSDQSTGNSTFASYVVRYEHSAAATKLALLLQTVESETSIFITETMMMMVLHRSNDVMFAFTAPYSDKIDGANTGSAMPWYDPV